MLDSSKKFKLSPSLRKEIRVALADKMIRAAQADYESALRIVKDGFVGVENLTDHQLIEDYSDWWGLYDESDFLNDPLIRKIADEQGTDAFEREFLGKTV